VSDMLIYMDDPKCASDACFQLEILKELEEDRTAKLNAWRRFYEMSFLGWLTL